MKYLALTLLFLSGLANAGIWHKSKVNIIYPLANGDFVIGLVTENSNCSNVNGFYRVYVDYYGVTSEGANKMYSAAIAAASQGKTIEINFDSDSGQCYINRLKSFY